MQAWANVIVRCTERAPSPPAPTLNAAIEASPSGATALATAAPEKAERTPWVGGADTRDGLDAQFMH